MDCAAQVGLQTLGQGGCFLGQSGFFYAVGDFFQVYLRALGRAFGGLCHIFRQGGLQQGELLEHGGKKSVIVLAVVLADILAV